MDSIGEPSRPEAGSEAVPTSRRCHGGRRFLETKAETQQRSPLGGFDARSNAMKRGDLRKVIIGTVLGVFFVLSIAVPWP